MSKKIKNPIQPKRAVKNNTPVGGEDALQYSRHNLKIVFDFAMGQAFNSCETGGFNNYLKSEADFADKFRQILTAVHKLSDKTVSELFDASGYRHCHNLEGKEDAVFNIMKKLHGFDDDYLTQNYGGERFYQAGLEQSVRLIGTIAGNIFRVLVVDYFHDLYSDEKHNVRAAKTHRYSLNVEF